MSAEYNYWNPGRNSAKAAFPPFTALSRVLAGAPDAPGRTFSDNPFGIVFRIFDPVLGPGDPFGIVFGIIDPVEAYDNPSGIVSGIFDPVEAYDYPFGIVSGIFDPDRT